MDLGIAAYGLRVYYSANELSKGLNQPSREVFNHGYQDYQAAD